MTISGFNVSDPVAVRNNDVAFNLTQDGVTWPFVISQEALQDVARFEGHNTPELSIAQFKEYFDKIIKVALKFTTTQPVAGVRVINTQMLNG